MEKKRVFLVDDHLMIIDGIKGMFQNDSDLEFVGTEVNGLAAGEAIEKMHNDIDLVVTDVNLPGISGTELCAQIKSKFPHIKVLIISMYQNNSVISEALTADADGYLLKTSGYKEFKQAITRILDGGSYYSESIYPIIWKEYQKEKVQQQLMQDLTPRELEVLQLIIKEFTSTEISDALCISKKTVDNHRQNLLHKTGSKSTIGLVKFAYKAGLKLEE